jgi:hypothetical protein
MTITSQNTFLIPCTAALGITALHSRQDLCARVVFLWEIILYSNLCHSHGPELSTHLTRTLLLATLGTDGGHRMDRSCSLLHLPYMYRAATLISACPVAQGFQN